MTFASTHYINQIVEAQKQGQAFGLYSVCSANRAVLEACLRLESAGSGYLLVESTCNQVNQFGGYTGLTPEGFASFVEEIARSQGFPADHVLLGGDHLGPNPWQSEPAEAALGKAARLVHDSVRAGYIKIHLDASMRCADDPPGPLDAEISAGRAAELCAAAEAAASWPGGCPPVDVVGTDVPTPGGAQAGSDKLHVTTPGEIGQTIDLIRQAFQRRSLEQAWERVIAVVVQPGVEFGDQEVDAYNREKAAPLSRYIEGVPGIIFEAHSTDYQQPAALQQMVEDHFAILKVGPALTFAYREAVFALDHIEAEWLGGRRDVALSNLIDTVEAVMLKEPGYWAKYYPGDEPDRRVARKYSLSDRVRYYWQHPLIIAALTRLEGNLAFHPAPLTLLSQYLPIQYQHIRAGTLANEPRALIWDHIKETVRPYARACGRTAAGQPFD